MGNIDLNDDAVYLFLKEEIINKKEKTSICHLTQCKRRSEKVRHFDVWRHHLSLCPRRIQANLEQESRIFKRDVMKSMLTPILSQIIEFRLYVYGEDKRRRIDLEEQGLFLLLDFSFRNNCTV